MLARFELEFEVDDWESYGCQRDEEDAADLALRDRRRRGGTLGDAGAGREEEREEREEVERVQVGAHGRGVGNRLDGGSDAKLRVGVGFVDGGAWVLGPFVAAAFVFAVVLDVVVVVGVVLLLILYVGGRCKKLRHATLVHKSCHFGNFYINGEQLEQRSDALIAKR